MTRAIRASLLAALVALPPLAPAADDPPNKDDEEHRKAAEKVVGLIDVEVYAAEKWTKAKRIEKPLLYYGDPTRENDRGSVWAWGDVGRPAVVAELYQNTTARDRWVYVLCNTSGGKVRASLGGREWWQANESATELKDVPGAPAPAGDAAGRQRQLKALAGKFAGHEFWDPNNSRFELRRLDRPLHTYRDPDAGLLDGALYALCNGTNPEILLFVEARGTPKGAKEEVKPAWRFAVGRLAHAELHLAYDGKEVFDAPRGGKLSGADKPYWLGFLSAAPSPKEDK